MSKLYILLPFLLITLCTKVMSQIEPDQIPGLELWVRATDGITFNGANVSSWTDLSPNGLTLDQSDPLRQATIETGISSLNGLPALKMDGIDDFYTLSASLENIRTVFLIYRHTTGTSTLTEPVLGHLSFFDFHGLDGTGLFRPASVSAGIVNGVCTVNKVVVPALQIQKPTEFTLMSIQSLQNLRFNQLSKDRTAARFWNGSYAEIIFFSTVLTPEEIEGIEKYIQERYSPPVDLGEDITNSGFCPVTLNLNSTFSSVQWSTGDMDPQIEVTAPGEYWVDVVDAFGFVSSDTVMITFPGNSLEDFELCAGEDSLWNPGLPASYTTIWQDDSELPTFLLSEAGTYSYTSTDSNGCQFSSESVSVFVDLFPLNIGIGIPSPYCIGNEIYLEGELENVESVLWSDGGLQESTVPTADGEYFVEVLSIYGCIARDTVQIASEGESPIANFSFQIECELLGLTLVENSVPPEGSTIEIESWMVDNNFVGNEELFTIENIPGSHNVELIVSTETGCTGSLQQSILVPGLPSISFPDVYYCAGVQNDFNIQTTLLYDNLESINWTIYDQEEIEIASTNGGSISAAMNNIGDYLVNATIEGTSGCVNVVSHFIEIVDSSFCFNPGSNINLALWFSADEGVVHDDDNNVEEWLDARSNGLSAIAPLETNQPIYVASNGIINDLPSIHFDGLNDYLAFDEITNIRSVVLLLKHDSGHQPGSPPIFGHASFFDFHGGVIDSLIFRSVSASQNIMQGQAKVNSILTSPALLGKT